MLFGAVSWKLPSTISMWRFDYIDRPVFGFFLLFPNRLVYLQYMVLVFLLSVDSVMAAVFICCLCCIAYHQTHTRTIGRRLDESSQSHRPVNRREACCIFLVSYFLIGRLRNGPACQYLLAWRLIFAFMYSCCPERHSSIDRFVHSLMDHRLVVHLDRFSLDPFSDA